MIKHSVVAPLQISIIIAKMHGTTLAPAPHLTLLTHAGVLPTAYAILLKTILPSFNKRIGINVTLIIVMPNAQATRYSTIVSYRCHIHPCCAEKLLIAHLIFISSQETLTPVSYLEFPLFSRFCYKIHKDYKLISV